MDGRGRALIRVPTTDGDVIRAPGTAGVSWMVNAPQRPRAAIQRQRLHLMSTVEMLALLEQRFGIEVDNFDAVMMNPRRTEQAIRNRSDNQAISPGNR